MAVGDFVNLPFGQYAVSISHDENQNGKLDTNLFNVPKEAHGFSTNAGGLFGPPGFEEAVFDFQTDGQVIEIQLH